MRASVLTLPGIGNSGADYWQTLWEGEDEKPDDKLCLERN